ncbi:MAG: ubiquinone/menaquinone biosynthesis methyltransferase [Nitrospinota bacterium]|nr:MAG: ubiquinone/menaquinone biosynthesis methyltransferase [Nitrospinota bacterium]
MESREDAVHRMFEKLAPRYDLYNRCVSLYLDEYWRRKAVASIAAGKRVLDIATGTGEMIFKLLQRKGWWGEAVGLDISQKMVQIAQQKLQHFPLQPRQQVRFIQGKTRSLPFASNSFDYVMSAFAMRNVIDHLDLALSEMRRILVPGGNLIILEINKPLSSPLRQLYFLYMKTMFLLHGWLLYKEKTPFVYLKDSVTHFFEPEEFNQKIQQAGFTDVQALPLTLGFVWLHRARKDSRE